MLGSGGQDLALGISEFWHLRLLGSLGVRVFGYARQEWQKMRERNEALDTRVYARAAAWILGADRFDERMWRQLERQAGVETAATVEIAATEKATEPQAGQITGPRRRGWKISTPRYME